MRDDRLAECHRLEREDTVPAGPQLVDDDVRSPVACPGLFVWHAFDDVEFDVELVARVDHELGAFLLAIRRRVHDERPCAVGWRDWGELAQIEPRWNDVCFGNPADRVVGAHDLGVRALAERELLTRLAANVRAEVVEDALLAQRPQSRELQRLGDQRQAEVEVEDVGLRSELRERPELRRQPTREPAVPVERPVGFVVQLPSLEDDEPSVDPLTPQRLHVLPGNAGDVDGTVRDTQPPGIVRHTSAELGLTNQAGRARHLWTIRDGFDTVVWRRSRGENTLRCRAFLACG